MKAPQRIRLSRKKGSRLPPGAKKVDRSTPFGNPFKAAEFGQARSVLMFANWLDGHRHNNRHALALMRQLMPTIAGRDLACWCKLCAAHADGKPAGVHCSDCEPCHVDVLIVRANPTKEPKP